MQQQLLFRGHSAASLPPHPPWPCSLVKPRLNGREVGYFILDTGASGFVLDPQAADALDLEAFGELQVGPAGACPARRCAGGLRLVRTLHERACET